ncbi:RHS repeat domain-containing protein [Enterobacter mori]
MNLNPELHVNTPAVTVAGSSGTPVRALAFLRHPDEAAAGTPARVLVSRTLTDIPARTGYLYGARPLRDAQGAAVSDAVTVSSLTGQTLRLHTADGDASFSLTDAAGRPLWARSAQGAVSTFTYEAPETAGRPLTVTETATTQDGTPRSRVRETFHYGPADADHRARNLAGALTVHRHNAGYSGLLALSLTGQPLSTEEQLLPADAELPDWSDGAEPETEAPLTTGGTYDATGAPLTQVNAAGVTTVTAYDVSGAVSENRLRYAGTAGEPERDIVTLRDILYRADGVVLSQTAGSGILETFVYDDLTQFLSRHTVQRPAGHPLGALVISDLHYAYDPAGNILQLNEMATQTQWHRNRVTDGRRVYAYDTLYRLISATGRERVMRAQRSGPLPRELTHSTAGSLWSPYTETYQYDDGDNLITQTHNGTESWTRSTAVSSQSNRSVLQESGQVPVFDPHGAYLVGGLRKALEDGRALTWHVDGQLRSVTLVSREEDTGDDTENYRYADPGTRVRKIRMTNVPGGIQTSVTTYIAGGEMRRRTLGNNTQLDISVTVSGGVRVVCDRLKGEVHLRYSFVDHLMSVSGETDDAGKITAREEYYPYGGSTGSDEETEELHDRTRRYSGKERDATGLYYYGFRYYQPESGRWLSADPGGLVDGVNLFRFCRANPVNITDADGRMPGPPPPPPERPASTFGAEARRPPIPSIYEEIQFLEKIYYRKVSKNKEIEKKLINRINFMAKKIEKAESKYNETGSYESFESILQVYAEAGSGMFKKVNNHLRGIKDYSANGEVTETIRDINKIFPHLPEYPHYAYRAFVADKGGYGQNIKEGDIIMDHGYMSLSTSEFSPFEWHENWLQNEGNDSSRVIFILDLSIKKKIAFTGFLPDHLLVAPDTPLQVTTIKSVQRSGNEQQSMLFVGLSKAPENIGELHSTEVKNIYTGTIMKKSVLPRLK